MKKIVKPKIIPHNSGKQTFLSKLSKFRHKKYWFLAFVLFFAIILIWPLSQSWLFKTSFSQAITYPKAYVLGMNVGGLNTDQLDSQLNKLKSNFEIRKIILVNDKKQWVFDPVKLGVTFDTKSTSQTILELNNLNIIDKYRLLTGAISSDIKPTILVNNDVCTKTLSVIPTVQINPVDASVYYDNGVKIKPDQSGNKFSVATACKELSQKLALNVFTFKVSLDTISANIRKNDLESKLSQIQAMVGESVSVKTDAYQQTFTSEQLFALLDISKKGAEVQVDWSSSRLDELVNGIADKVNTYDGGPALGACQYLASSGGNWLDKTATKKIFTDLGAGSSKSYTLPIGYYAPVVGNRSPVAHGNSGTIYLTFDDGMTYADQIMNYAACYGVKVTFFEIGGRAASDAPQLRRAIAEGHAVQSHGHYHAMYDYGSRNYDWQNDDIGQSIVDIMSVTGVRPTYFRPPGGNRSSLTYQAAAANGLSLILWGDSSADSTVGGISSATTCANVLAGAYPGASVLMHSTHQTSASAVPCIVEGLAARGYNMQALR